MGSDLFHIVTHSREGVSLREVGSRDVTEELRKLGLEWKISDWPHDQAVTIVVRPATSEAGA